MIKYIIGGVLIFTIGFIQRDAFVLQGEWQLNLVRINSDTMFYRGHVEYSYTYNWKLKRDFPETKQDTNAILDRVKEGYNKTKKVKILFYKDSLFNMTRIRSGGKLFLNEYDSGVYVVSNDTVFMTNKTRKNRVSILVIDKQREKLFLKDGFPDYMIYLEYRKKRK